MNNPAFSCVSWVIPLSPIHHGQSCFLLSTMDNPAFSYLPWQSHFLLCIVGNPAFSYPPWAILLFPIYHGQSCFLLLHGESCFVLLIVGSPAFSFLSGQSCLLLCIVGNPSFSCYSWAILPSLAYREQSWAILFCPANSFWMLPKQKMNSKNLASRNWTNWNYFSYCEIMLMNLINLVFMIEKCYCSLLIRQEKGKCDAWIVCWYTSFLL